MGVRAVSGRATLAGFTVNHRFGLPGLPPPYVVAQVAIAEDPRVRLTTNIVDCDPDELELGQQVEVVFEQVEDVWLPLFRPASTRRRARRAAGRRDRAGAVRRIRPADADHGEVRRQGRRITGIGMSPIGRRLMVPPLSLTIDACEAAVADAGLTFDDIDGLSTYPGLDIGGHGRRRGHRAGGCARACGRRGSTAAWTPSAPAVR